MQALIIDKEAARLDHSQISLMEAGIYVTGTASVHVAEICISRMAVDLLVIEKSTVGDALGDLLGIAEERNPFLVSILRTSDVGGDHDELSPHFPSLHCVLGEDVSNDFAVQLGLASLRAQMSLSAASNSLKRPMTQAISPLVPSPLVTRAAVPMNAYAQAS